MMNRYQKLHFNSIAVFLAYLPEEEYTIVERLREFITATFPKYHEKLAYDVPFYYNHKRICFIWPSETFAKFKVCGKFDAQ